MTISIGEVGKLFDLGTGFDLSSNTELELNFTQPDGTKFTLTKTAGRVSAPASISAEGFPANTYFQITTIAADFLEAGTTWQVCGIYSDATPKVFHGQDAIFTVGEACD